MKAKSKPSKPKTPPASPAPQPAEPQRQPSSQVLCPVVAVGASAGGLEAFQEMLENLPEDSGLAFVFIQHLDPKHVSILGELLSRSTTMPVLQVQDQMRVEPNAVYVIPPNVGMRLNKCKLTLTERAHVGPHMPIDEFFQSLAQERGSRSIAVILSGTASDGTLGLKAVKAVGGITFAQDGTAKFDAMPHNAIAAGGVDLVLPPHRIAQEILRLCKHPYVAAAPAPSQPAAADSGAAEQDRFIEIFQLLRTATGVDFALYKHGTLQRRILRRMALHKIETAERYAQFLRDNAQELKALFHDILISVTGFFREPSTFDGLKKLVFPAIFRDRSPENPVRVWVPGCSTGEEAYSVAICLLEYMRDAALEIPIQIFGTDLSEPALERARAGVYPDSIAADVSVDRLRRFFLKLDGQYQVSRAVRDICVFAQQNLTKDPPFSKLDLITCRNLLIYLGPPLQSKVMRFFHYGLKPVGFLVLGLSETVGDANELFAPTDKHLRIYARKAGVSTVDHLDFSAYGDARLGEHPRRKPTLVSTHDVQRRVDQYILNRYSPAGILIDEHMNILQFHGRTSPYLEHGVGEPNLNISRMLRPELVVAFRKVFGRARKKHVTIRGEALRVAHLDRIHNVCICVTPLVLAGGGESQYLVLFEEQTSPQQKGKQRKAARPPEKVSGAARRVRDLEDELNSTKHYLESVIEEQQSTTEELKSAHEEVQSSNEELQSTNEELLTAKEELQSTNEELSTVNDEVHARNAELSRINNDLSNLLSSVNIPIVMLGNDLRIRRFTPQAEKVLNLLTSDVGRPLSDFKPKIDIPDLEELFLDVIENLHVNEREVRDQDGRWFSMWIRPYRTAENRIDGAVLAMFDITERKQAVEARYRHLFEASTDGILMADGEAGEIIDLNPYLAKTFGLSRSGSVGVKFWDLEMFRGTKVDSRSFRELLEQGTMQASLTARNSGGERVHLEAVGNVYFEGDRRIVQLNIRDLSERKRLEEDERRLQMGAQQPLEVEAIGRLAGAVTREFNNLLTTVGGYTWLLKRNLSPENALSHDVEQIHWAMERATRLTRQILAFERRHSLQPEIVDLNELLQEIEQIIRAALPGTMELHIHLLPGLKLVKIDRGQMGQVVLNLVAHARESLPDRGLTIATRNTTVDEDYAREHPAVPPGEYVVLEVSHLAPPADEAGVQVLEPLLSAPDRQHAALSLSGIYDAVRRSGGYLWAASELGRGSTLRIFLPEASQPLAAPAEHAGDGALRTGGETILLVEPEEIVRSLTARILQECGYTVLQAAQGAEALELIRAGKQPVNLLLTALEMPQMTGRELAQKVAVLHPEARALFMPNDAEEPAAHPDGSGPPPALLRKPFTPEALSQSIREVLES